MSHRQHRRLHHRWGNPTSGGAGVRARSGPAEALAEGRGVEGDPAVAAVAPDGSLLVRIWVPEPQRAVVASGRRGAGAGARPARLPQPGCGRADTDGRYVAYGLTSVGPRDMALYVGQPGRCRTGAADRIRPEEWGMLHPPIVRWTGVLGTPRRDRPPPCTATDADAPTTSSTPATWEARSGRTCSFQSGPISRGVGAWRSTWPPVSRPRGCPRC